MDDNIDPRWRKASYSGGNGGSCVEVGSTPGNVLVRDTKQEGRPTRTVLVFGADAWQHMIKDVKVGKLALSTTYTHGLTGASSPIEDAPLPFLGRHARDNRSVGGTSGAWG